MITVNEMNEDITVQLTRIQYAKNYLDGVYSAYNLIKKEKIYWQNELLKREEVLSHLLDKKIQLLEPQKPALILDELEEGVNS